MIKRTELQMGNIVLNGPAKAAILWEIIELYPDCFVLYSEFMKTRQTLVDEEDLYPVPIDNHLLKKIGFFFEQRLDTIEGDGRVPIDKFTKRGKVFEIILTKDFDSPGLFYFKARSIQENTSLGAESPIQYIHELQNEVMRCTGEKLIISTQNG